MYVDKEVKNEGFLLRMIFMYYIITVFCLALIDEYVYIFMRPVPT